MRYLRSIDRYVQDPFHLVGWANVPFALRQWSSSSFLLAMLLQEANHTATPGEGIPSGSLRRYELALIRPLRNRPVGTFHTRIPCQLRPKSRLRVCGRITGMIPTRESKLLESFRRHETGALGNWASVPLSALKPQECSQVRIQIPPGAVWMVEHCSCLVPSHEMPPPGGPTGLGNDPTHEYSSVLGGVSIGSRRKEVGPRGVNLPQKVTEGYSGVIDVDPPDRLNVRHAERRYGYHHCSDEKSWDHGCRSGVNDCERD